MELQTKSTEYEEEDYSVLIAEQADSRADAETEQDDVSTEKWAEDDFQLNQEIERERSGTQILAEAEIEHQDWLTGEEEKTWAFEHEKPSADPFSSVDRNRIDELLTKKVREVEQERSALWWVLGLLFGLPLVCIFIVAVMSAGN